MKKGYAVVVLGLTILLLGVFAVAQEAANISILPIAATVCSTLTSSSTAGFIPMTTAPCTIQNSSLSQSGTSTLNANGSLNIRGGALTLIQRATANSTTGQPSRPEIFVNSVFDSGLAVPVPKSMLVQLDSVGNNTTNTSAALNFYFRSGSAAFLPIGISILPTGTFNAKTINATNISANAIAANGLAVSGAASVGSLTAGSSVTGGSGSFGSLNVTGAASVGGNLASGGIVSGAAGSFSGGVGVGGSLSVGSNLSVGGTITGSGAPLVNVPGVLLTQLLGNTGISAPAAGYFNFISNYIPPVNVRAFTFNRCGINATAAGQQLYFRSAIRNPTGGSVIVGNAFYLAASSAGAQAVFDENNDWFDLTAGQSYDFGVNFLNVFGNVQPQGSGFCSVIVQIFTR